jgi:hypothetical protein
MFALMFVLLVTRSFYPHAAQLILDIGWPKPLCPQTRQVAVLEQSLPLGASNAGMVNNRRAFSSVRLVRERVNAPFGDRSKSSKRQPGGALGEQVGQCTEASIEVRQGEGRSYSFATTSPLVKGLSHELRVAERAREGRGGSSWATAPWLAHLVGPWASLTVRSRTRIAREPRAGGLLSSGRGRTGRQGGGPAVRGGGCPRRPPNPPAHGESAARRRSPATGALPLPDP